MASSQELPLFKNGAIVRQTINFRLVMGYKPGQEQIVAGRRFYIEPRTYKGQRILMSAITQHHTPYDGILTRREVPTKSGKFKVRTCVRANFHPENIPTLLLDQTIIPAPGGTSMPSLNRMEQCIKFHPDRYTFTD